MLANTGCLSSSLPVLHGDFLLPVSSAPVIVLCPRLFLIHLLLFLFEDMTLPARKFFILLRKISNTRKSRENEVVNVQCTHDPAPTVINTLSSLVSIPGPPLLPSLFFFFFFPGILKQTQTSYFTCYVKSLYQKLLLYHFENINTISYHPQ